MGERMGRIEWWMGAGDGMRKRSNSIRGAVFLHSRVIRPD